VRTTYRCCCATDDIGFSHVSHMSPLSCTVCDQSSLLVTLFGGCFVFVVKNIEHWTRRADLVRPPHSVNRCTPVTPRNVNRLKIKVYTCWVTLSESLCIGNDDNLITRSRFHLFPAELKKSIQLAITEVIQLDLSSTIGDVGGDYIHAKYASKWLATQRTVVWRVFYWHFRAVKLWWHSVAQIPS
jgi:hypothetical protein